MNEIWADIKGFESFYQISNYGHVKSLAHNIILKAHPNSQGYLRVELKVNGKHARHFVHRLVAIYFVDNPNSLPIVNHLDCNPLNNFAQNLEWTTLKGNSQYAVKFGNSRRTAEWVNNLKKSLDIVMAKPVIGICISTGKEVLFNALNDTKASGFQPSCVCQCCKGLRSTHKGYKWRYA